ncbi:MAG: heparinase II/III family protein [Clostridia bacterium]
MNIYEVDKRLLETHSEMVDKIRNGTLEFAKSFKDSPENMSDWAHKYFCPDDGGPLIFDLEKPFEHVCSSCGKSFSNKEFNDTWTNLYRRVVFNTVLNLAVLYKLEGNPEYMAEYKRLLTFYADHYQEFVYHSKHVLCPRPQPIVDGRLLDAGKIMPQALNEADVLVKIMTSFEILKDDIDQEFVDMMSEKLLIPAIEICLKPQIVKVHNKPCIQSCTIGIVGLFTGNQELIDYAFDGEYGLNRQLREGVTADKFWFEGSIHYHFFTCEALVHLLAFAEIYNKEFEGKQTIIDMLTAPYYYAFDNDVFPNPNDGWPDRTLKAYDFSYALAAKALGEDSEISNIYKNVLAKYAETHGIAQERPYYYEDDLNFSHLICFPYLDISDRKPIERKSMCYKSSYFANLKNQNFNVFLKYAHASPSHSHPDKMNTEVMVKDKVLSKDLSNPGYAAHLYSVWYRRTISHNTVVVDGQDHQYIVQGDVLDFNENYIATEAKGAYDGVDFKRAIALKEDGFNDVFEVISEDVHNYDYVFHCDGTLKTEIDAVAGDVGYKENGYETFQDIRKVNCTGDSITLKWLFQDVYVESTIDVKDKELFIIKTYDNPASKFRTSIFLREKAKCSKFTIDWKLA